MKSNEETTTPCTTGACGRADGRAARFRRALVSQFGRPRGIAGRLAGAIMAHRPSNVERSLWTVSLLDLRPTDRVLEIGFGPGIAIAEASRQVREGRVVGLDHSEVMWRQASKRNRRAIRAGRVQLAVGSFDVLAGMEDTFDKIFAVNSIAFWPRPAESLELLAAHLEPGGTIALTEQPRTRGATDKAAIQAAERLEGQLAEAGFVELRRETLPLKPVPAVCVLGRTRVS